MTLKSMKDMKDKTKHAEIISLALKARSDLYLCDFITEAENDKIHKRIRKYQDKYKVDGSLIKTNYS